MRIEVNGDTRAVLSAVRARRITGSGKEWRVSIIVTAPNGSVVTHQTDTRRFQQVARAMFRFSASLMTVLMLANTVMAADTAQMPDLETLQVELKQLQQSFGKDHPRVVAIQKRIGLMERLGQEVEHLPEHQAIIDRLLPLLFEEQALISKFGNAHPKVKEIRRRIEFTAKYFTNKLQRASDAAAKKTGKADSVHDAFIKMLLLLLREQELIAKYGPKHSSVTGIRKQIALTRPKVVVVSPINRVPGRTRQVPESDNSPGVDDDTDKPGRYSMETQNGNIVLVDRETGRTWMMKTGARQTEWIPIPHGRKSP
jgi:hypothetical protein